MAPPQRKNKKRNGAAAAEEEVGGVDRISGLPDELIFLIFSFLDAKLAVQTCILSTRWKNLWKSLPVLTFDWECFHAKTRLSKFVNKLLSGRDRAVGVSTINFTSDWAIEPPLFKRILRYGFSHGIQNLEITNDRNSESDKPCLIPTSMFRSQSLKHLSLVLASQSSLDICPSHPPEQTLGPHASIRSPWNLPNLTSLYLHFAPLKFSCNYAAGTPKSADPFSSLVSLKDLSLIYCDTFNLDVLHIVSVSLENLTIFTFSSYQWEPQSKLHVVVSAPKLMSFNYRGVFPLSISAAADQQLSCLREATISIIPMGRPEYEIPIGRVQEMLRMVCNAEFLTISTGTVGLLWRAGHSLENPASPLGNLKRLTVDVSEYSAGVSAIFISEVQAYFLKSSPKASMKTLNAGRPYR